jgi:predicted MFS family arabinose efflux permease
MVSLDRTPAPVIPLVRNPLSSAFVLWSSAVFALQIGIARLGYGLALPAIRGTLHGNYTLYGTINAASLAGYLAGALIAPLVMRRFRSAVLLSSLVAGAALMLSAFANDALAFGIERTLFGLASGVSLVAAAVQTLEAMDARQRGSASAIMWGGIGIGLLLSALGAGWVVHGSMHWRIGSLVAGLLTALAGIGYEFAERREGTVLPSPSQTEREPLQARRFWLLSVAYFCFGFAYIAYATFIVALIDGRLGIGGAQSTITLLWALYGVASVIGTTAIGRILHRPIGRNAMVFTGIVGAVGCAIVSIWPAAAIPSAFFVGLGLTATPAAATAFARARSTPHNASIAIAAVTVAVGVGQLVGPLAAGIAADRLGLNAAVLVACAVYLIGTLFAAADARTA